MTDIVRPYGLHPLAFAALVTAGIPVSRCGQTIGSAPASAGTHAKDGEYQGHDYCAATDFHIRDLDTAGTRHLCDQLAGAGFLPFYRNPGVNGWPADQARHIHAIWPGCPCKQSLRAQVHDYLGDRTGLVGHADYTFRPPTKEECDVARAAFLSHNPMDN